MPHDFTDFILLSDSDSVYIDDSIIMFGRGITPVYFWAYSCRTKHPWTFVDLEQKKFRLTELLQSSMEVKFYHLESAWKLDQLWMLTSVPFCLRDIIRLVFVQWFFLPDLRSMFKNIWKWVAYLHMRNSWVTLEIVDDLA